MNGDIGTTEFHAAAWDSNAHIAIGGAQDTGTPQQTATSNPRWASVSTSDGSDVAVDDTSTPGRSVRYSSWWNFGNARRLVYDAANTQIGGWQTLNLTVLGGGNAFVPQFYTPIELNNVDQTRMIIGGANSVYESLDQGTTMTEIGPGIRVNGLGADPIGYGATGNAEMVYVGAGSQVLVRTAAAPAPLNVSATYPGTGQIADIAIDPGDPQTSYVVDNTNVYLTMNAGTSWTDVTGNLAALDPGDLLSVTYDAGSGTDAVIVGADNGVFSANAPSFNNWSRLGMGLPRAPVWDLEYDAVDNLVLAGTLGRGVWTLDRMATTGGFRRALSLHVGTAVPLATLNSTHNPGPTVTVDYLVPLAQRWALDFRLGYARFAGISSVPDVEAAHLSMNLKAIPILTVPWAFLNAGLGLYSVDWNSPEAGFNLGLGVGQPLGPNLDLEASINYHRVFTVTPDLEFAKIQVGFIWAF